MCGIAGTWGQANGTAVMAMLDRLAHRGPDGMGLDRPCAEVVLGHRRLAIMDPTGGAQPLFSDDRRRALVANGEIYNYPALRRRLTADYEFATNSDSEAALHLFEEHGTRACAQLDGMFALAIADGDDLFLARDPLGIKPLYTAVSRDGEQLWFASELKALTGLSGCEVSEFPPGCWFHSRHGLQRYWSLPIAEPEHWRAVDAVAALRAELERAVAKRLMSDVPVGAFLSGGLDSSLLCALARPMVDELHTFAVGLDGSPDLVAARRVAEHLDTVHHEYIITAQEMAEALPTILYHLESFDQDLVRSAIPCYFCSRLAAEQVKVVLTGEGADELFAGYTYHRAMPLDALHEELHRSVLSLHNINLQRVDRLTMAHGLEARVPFLDTDLVDLALRMPVDLKLRSTGDGELVEKYILRLVAEPLLPAEIVWRGKQQFDEGSGTVDALAAALAPRLDGFDHRGWRQQYPEARLRSPEEAWYHHLLCRVFDDPRAVLANVGRWSHRPNAAGEGSHPLASALS